MSGQIGLVALAFPIVVASAVMAARRPLWSVSALLLLMTFEGTFVAYLGAGVRPFVWILLLGLFASTIAGYLNSSRSRAIVIWPGIAAFAAYLALSAIQIPFAETTEIGARGFVAGPALLVAFFAFAYARWSAETRWKVAKAFAAIALLGGVYALFRLIVGPSDTELTLYRPSADIAGDLSLFGSFSGRVELGAFAAIAIPSLFSIALATRGRWRWVAAASTVLMIVALLGSEVRTALVGAALGVVLVTALVQVARAFRGRAGLALLATVVAAVAGVVGYGLTLADDPESSERFSRILTPGKDFSFQQRVEKWDAALARINDHPFGEGLGSTGTTQRLYSHVYRLDNRYIDNSYLQLGVQQGYPGWILMGVAVVLIGFMLIRSSLETTDLRLSAIGIGAVGSLLAWLVTLMTGEILTSWGGLLLWILLGLAVGGFVAAGPGRPTRAR